MCSRTNSLPIGFAEQVLNLEIKLQEEEETQEIIQMLTQMYRIALEYYIDIDDRKAMYFQRKLNMMMVKSLQVQPSRKKIVKDLPTQIRKEMKKFQQCQNTYLKSFIENSIKAEEKFKSRLQADLEKQQSQLNNRMMKRIKSNGKLILTSMRNIEDNQ